MFTRGYLWEIHDKPWQFLNFHIFWGWSWIIMDLLGIPIKTTHSLGEWLESGRKWGPSFYVFYMFHIKTKLKTSKHTQKKGPPFISNHSLGDFPMVFRWFSFLRHCKELACRHGPRQDGRGILRSGTTRDAGNINEDGPEAYPHREYI